MESYILLDPLLRRGPGMREGKTGRGERGGEERKEGAEGGGGGRTRTRGV